ncbi:MAG: GAF domain-containing protein [Geobacteraceae bacterium]|nr:GAF domain-containing protein [Geobacteraceae bacterium]
MTDDKYRATFKVLNWAIGLLLVWLAVDVLAFPRLGEGHIYLQLVPLFFLVILGLIGRKARKTEKAAHAREIEEMRREVEKTAVRYKSLLEGAGDAIFVINAGDGLLEEMNGMGTSLLGYSREEMGTLAGRDLFHETDQLQFTSLVRRVNRYGMASSACLTFRRKDGSHFLGEVNARLIDLGDEQVVQAIIRDITQKKQAEQEIRKRNRKLSFLNNIIARANASLDLHTVLDVTLQETLEVFAAEGGAIHLLEGEEQLLNLVAMHNLPDRFLAGARQGELAAASPCHIVATRQCYLLADGSRSGCKMARHAGEEGWQSVAGIPLFAKNRLIGVMHIMHTAERRYSPDDINFFTTMGNQLGIVIEHARLFAELNWKTAVLLRSHRLLEKNSRQLALSENRLKKNLALVEQANLELERLDRMKSNFLGMVSHEFKTPLTGILGSAEFLLANRGKASDDDERLLLSIIRDGGTRLNEIVTDLLKVARLEAKGSPVSKAPLHLEGILDALMEQFAPLLLERNQRVVFKGIESLPYFCGDRECLYEVFTELLENAVKFTPDGGETVIAARVVDRTKLAGKKDILAHFNPPFYEQMGDAGYLQVEVLDSGVGIAAEERLKIFDTFYEIGEIRHHSSGRDKFQGKGAGLGLAIVKGMIEAHGGMVWVESPASASSGSAFFLLIPLEEGTSQPALPFMQQEPGHPLPGQIDYGYEETH